MDKPTRIQAQLNEHHFDEWLRIGYNKSCDDWEAYHQQVLNSIIPCSNPECDHGKALIPGTSETDNCPVCKGTGSVIKEE